MGHVPKEPMDFLLMLKGILQRFLPEARISVAPEFGLAVDGGLIDLQNLLNAIKLRPKKGTRYMTLFAEKLANSLRLFSGLGHSWEFWRDRLVPRIVRRDQVPAGEREFLVLAPVVADLDVMAAVDLPEAVVPLPLAQVIQWGLESEVVLDEARDNLRARLKQLSLKSADAPDGTKIVWSDRTSTLNSALLALPDLFSVVQRLAGIVVLERGATFGVCVPTREVFLAHTKWATTVSKDVTARMLKRSANMPHPLSDRSFRLLPDGVADVSS